MSKHQINNSGLFKKMEHIGLGAIDTSTLSEWYCDIFDLHIISKIDGNPPFYFLSDETRSFTIEIFPVTTLSENQEKAIHFCFAVEDLEQAITYLHDKGIDTGNVVDVPKGGKTLFFSDPANHTVQVVYRPTALWD